MNITFEIIMGEHEYTKTIDMPAIVHAGDMVDTGDGNYRKAQEIYHKPDGIRCWLASDQSDSAKALKKSGYKKQN